MGTNVNRNSSDEITQELCSSKVDEACVRQWVEVEEHDKRVFSLGANSTVPIDVPLLEIS